MKNQIKQSLWHSTKEQPVDGSQCLIDTTRDICVCYWNQRDNCWDDAEGDGYYCSMRFVKRWMYIRDIL